ncbi:MAG TPA: carboxypeptidase-like regulatory domain-containing protein [Terriglobia bacterium]|nr:carboxypeptidase-like regulatory domain-containing protein [Terriglobia bacterium]
MKSFSILSVISIIAVYLLMKVEPVVSTAPQQSEKGAIQGLVVREGSNTPLPGVKVTVFQGGSDPLTTLTDSNGGFVLRGLAGTNTVQFIIQGYTPRATSVTVTAGQTVTGLMMKLTQQGKVSGEVHDLGGNPIARVSVVLMTKDYYNDHWQLSPSGNAETDDRGQYRIFGVNPGNYFLQAFPTETNPGRAYVTRFYPDSFDLSQAVQVRVLPESDLHGLNFTFQRESLFHVRGRIVEDDGHAPNSVRLSFERVNTLSSDSGDIPYDSGNGTFEIPGLPIGRYTLHAAVPGSACATNAGSGYRETGDTTITIAGADLENVVIPLRQAACLSGMAKLPDGDSGDVSSFEFKLVSETSWLSGYFSAERDGAIKAVALVPGTYDLFLHSGSDNYYIKSARFGNMDVAYRSFDFQTPNATSLQIVLGLKTAALTGIVRDENNQPCAGATVILVPVSAGDSGTRNEISISDQNGQFIFKGGPGDYRVFAFESLEYLAWMQPDFLDKYNSQGTTVRLKEDATGTATVHLVTGK